MDEKAPKCIACRQGNVRIYFDKIISLRSYPIYTCDNCGTAFTWPRPEQAKIEEYYSSLSYHSLTTDEAAKQEERYYPSARLDARRIIRHCRKLNSGNQFLDAGAGFGDFSKAAAEMGFRVTACEPNPNARKIFLTVTGFEAESDMFDNAYAERHPGAFNVVLLSHVLEHTIDPEAVTKNVHKVLRPSGIAMIAVPQFRFVLSRFQGKKDMFISPPEHLNYFTKRGLKVLFERNGFKLVFLKTPSKIHKAKFIELVRIPILRDLVWRALFGILAFWNPFKMGMVINAYFRKIYRALTGFSPSSIFEAGLIASA